MASKRETQAEFLAFYDKAFRQLFDVLESKKRSARYFESEIIGLLEQEFGIQIAIQAANFITKANLGLLFAKKDVIDGIRMPSYEENKIGRQFIRRCGYFSHCDKSIIEHVIKECCSTQKELTAFEYKKVSSESAPVLAKILDDFIDSANGFYLSLFCEKYGDKAQSLLLDIRELINKNECSEISLMLDGGAGKNHNWPLQNVVVSQQYLPAIIDISFRNTRHFVFGYLKLWTSIFEYTDANINLSDLEEYSDYDYEWDRIRNIKKLRENIKSKIEECTSSLTAYMKA